MNKKVFLTFSFLPALLLSSCGYKPKTYSTTISIAMFDNIATTIPFNVPFDERALKEQSSTVDLGIAKLSMILCANISTSSSATFIDLEKQTKGFDDYTTIYENLELNDFKIIEVNGESDLDPYDITKLHLAHKKIDNYDIALCTVIDSDAGVQWVSDFDFGADDDVYFDKTGLHPEWTNYEEHKGFSIAANRASRYIKSYYANVLDKDANKLIYVFGHSRGGAVGNIIAKNLIDDGYNTSAYLMASPVVTSSKNAKDEKYQKIFNYVNTSDLITNIIPPKWGLSRYGQDINFKIEDYKKELERLMGSSLPSNNVSKLLEIIHSLAGNRVDIYLPDEELIIAEGTDLTSEECDALYEEKTKELRGVFAQLKPFLEMQKIAKEEGKYDVKLLACPAFYLLAVGLCLTNGIENAPTLASQVSDLLKTFLDYAKLSIADFAGLLSTVRYMYYSHFFPAYATYYNLDILK